MKTPTRTIKFDLAKAKTPDNPDGLEVVNGFGTRMRIICTDLDNFRPIVAVKENTTAGISFEMYTKDGINQPCCSGEGYRMHDLRLISPEPTKIPIEVWGVIYMKGTDWFASKCTFVNNRELAEETAGILSREGYEHAQVIKMLEYDEEVPL